MIFSKEKIEPSRQGITTAATYAGTLEAYQKIGLLTDIAPPHRRQSPGFIRMCLARAEVYRQQMLPAKRKTKRLAIIPLGPLEDIKLLHNKHLDRYLHGEVVDNKCGICDEPVSPKDTVFTMCECTKMSCRSCIMNNMATVNPDDREDSRSYLSPDLPKRDKRMISSVRCPSCRSKSYSVFGVEDARAEEERLLRGQFPTLLREGPLKRKQNENGLYYDRIGEYCRQLMQEPRLHGEYELLFPESSKAQLLTYVEDTWLSSAQQEAARLCALLKSGPGNTPSRCNPHTLS